MLLDGRKFGDQLVERILPALTPLLARVEAIEKRAPVPGPKGDDGKVDQSAVAKAIEEGIAKALPVAVERAVAQVLPDIIQRASAAVPKPSNGKDGERGKDADEAAILARLTEHMLREVAALPKAIDGRDGKDAPAVDEAALVAKVLALVPVPKDGKDGKDGKDAAPAKDGKDAPAVDVDSIVERVRAQIPTPQNGKDGASVDFDAVVAKAVSLIPVPKNGENGTSVTMDDLRPVVEAETARWQLEFERRAADVLRDAIEKMPRPQDGKDGRDGMSVEDLDVKLEGRILTITLGNSADPATFKQRWVKVPFPLDKGVYRSGTEYEKGDVVTYGGSQWIALKDTQGKPPSDDWRCQVQRGRDGKDAE